MSMIKAIGNLPKDYLYQRIIHLINENISKYQKKVEKYNEDSRQIIFNKIKNNMKDSSTESNTDNITLKEMYKYFEDISEYYSSFKNKTLFCLTNISKNLLFTKINNEVIFNFDDVNNEKIFTINDFIYNYTLEALDTEFLNKQTFNDIDNIGKLYDIYLYLIFKIQEPNFIIQLKSLIYYHLYNIKNDDKDKYNKIINFIVKISESIKTNIYDNENLIKFQKMHGEININMNIVPDNVPIFFNRKRIRINDILNSFTLKKIKDNYKKIEGKHIYKEEIVVDNPNIIENNKNKNNIQNKNKSNPKLELSPVYFFSPEFLITNGLKSNIDNCDLEIFNSDNYSVDIFSKYITLIIDEINKSIELNDFSNDFIKNNLIYFHNDNYLHYISSSLDYSTKTKLYSVQKNIEKNDFLKINVLNQYQYKKKSKESDSKKQNTKESNNINQKKTDIKSNLSNEISNFPSKSVLTSSINSYIDLQKKIADDFEDLINTNFTEKIKKDKLILLPNLLFFLNLKIPEYDNQTNSIYFKSVHLDSFIEEKKDVNENYFYGCKEIDCIFQNISEKPIDVTDPKYFCTNLTYVKKGKDYQFNKDEENVNSNGFKINPNSIVFCEIKKSFPNIENGREDVNNVKVEEIKPEKKSKEVSTAKNYDNQLIKLIKKFKYFYQVFKDKKSENKKVDNIHFIFLYDTLNIADDNCSLVDEMTSEILKQYCGRLNYKETIIFQLVFFDLTMFHRNNKNIIIENKKEIEEKNRTIEEKDKTIQEKDKTIEENKKEIKEKNKTIQEKDKTIEEKNKTIEENKKEIENQKNIIFGMLKLNNSVQGIIQNEKLNQKNKAEEIFKLNNGIIPIDIIESYIKKFE